MQHHITEFTAILAAYAAGHTVHWKHEGYRLAGGPDPDRIVVQYPANGHCCGLFHADGVTSSYDPADFQIVPVSRPLAEQLPACGKVVMTASQSALKNRIEREALEVARETGKTPAQLIEALHDARKALLAASAHLVPTTNAAALVAASVKEIEGILGYPVHRNNDSANLLTVDPSENRTRPQSRRCMEDRAHLKD